jgi:hypothetical protein
MLLAPGRDQVTMKQELPGMDWFFQVHQEEGLKPATVSWKWFICIGYEQTSKHNQVT